MAATKAHPFFSVGGGFSQRKTAIQAKIGSFRIIRIAFGTDQNGLVIRKYYFKVGIRHYQALLFF